MMEHAALNESHPAVAPYAVGTVVELDAGTGTIDEAIVAPNGQTYYAIEYVLPSGDKATCTRWHDEIALHPVDAAVMAIADDANHSADVGQMVDPVNAAPTSDAIAAALVTGGAPSMVQAESGPSLCGPDCASHATISAGFQALLDKGAAIIASIDPIKPGDLVVLRSGGPQMIVEKICENGDLMCWWMDHTANLHVARFNRLLVELVPSFNHAELRA